MNEILTTAEMYQADAGAVARGARSIDLMEQAGGACAREILVRWPRIGRVAILCGPGNNGGDGFVIARHLAGAGYDVRLSLLGNSFSLRGDAARMAELWSGEVHVLEAGAIGESDLIVDALFGAGLSRSIDGIAAAAIDQVNAWPAPVLSVDMPSGIDGTTGAVCGSAIKADVTVTFFRKKPGHLLLPGRLHCGEVVVADIGIRADVLDDIEVRLFENTTSLWQAQLPQPQPDGHKYDRGHAVALTGGMTSTGAGRLAARGALRAGAGLVTVASPADALQINAAHLTAIMLQGCDDAAALARILADERRNAVVLGPALGVGAKTREFVLAALASPAQCVLDADALVSFADAPEALFEPICSRRAGTVLTPHAGEFGKLFGDTGTQAKVEAVRRAAASCGAIVVLKGADTVVAAPDGRAAINAASAPWLATAGSGDVLAGMICGLLAAHMAPFEAAAAAVYLHGAAGATLGPGLVAEDLPEAIPGLLRHFWQGA